MTSKDFSADPFRRRGPENSSPQHYSDHPDTTPPTSLPDDLLTHEHLSDPIHEPSDPIHETSENHSSQPQERLTQPQHIPFPDEELLPASSHFSLLTLGTAVVIGAMAANVVGFRYSRWAVGKDLHRGWETHQRNTAGRSAREKARRVMHERARRAAQQAANAEQAERKARAERADTRARADRQARDETRGSYQRWESVFRDGGAEFFRNVRVEVDPHVVEELLRAQRGASRGSSRGNPFGMTDDMLDELLQAARAAQDAAAGQGAGWSRRDAHGDPFHFWEQMQGAQWRDFQRQAGAGTRTGQSGGVFSRAGLSRHYSALGLDINATDEQVKRAYRKEVMKWHPDKYRGGQPEAAAQRFREVTAAYNALIANK